MNCRSFITDSSFKSFFIHTKDQYFKARRMVYHLNSTYLHLGQVPGQALRYSLTIPKCESHPLTCFEQFDLSSLLAATVVTYWSRKIFKRILFLSSGSKSSYRVESHILELDWVDLHFTFWMLHHPACASIYRSCPLNSRTFQSCPSIKSPGS